MKTTLVSKENNIAKLTMDFTAEEFEEAINKVYRKNRGQFVINGFRKGKAPRSIIERHYGEGIFFEDAINDLLNANYPAAVQELALDVIDRPAMDFSDIGKNKPFTVTATVDLFPIIPVSDYKGIAVDKLIDPATEEDVNRQIENLRKRNARMVEVDRPVQEGDTIRFDYAGFIGDEQFEGGTAENQGLKIGSGQFIPGFEDQLIGAECGQELDVNVTFPEDYHQKDLAGKEAVFHCEIHEVKEEQLPELDDDFAMDVSEFDTLEELINKTRADIQESREQMAENIAKDEVVNKVYEAAEVEVPAVMVEDEIQQIMSEMDQQLRYQGLSLDQYFQFTGGNEADFRESVREDATRRAGTRIVLLSIADAEGMEVTEEDLDKELSTMAEQYGMELEQVKNAMAGSMDFLKKDIMVKKVIDMLYDEAEVTEKEKPQTEVTEEVPAESEEAAEAEEKVEE